MLTETQLKNRRKTIGGSEIKLLINEDYETFFNKRSLSPNQHIVYGNLMEPLIRDYVNKKTNSNYKEHYLKKPFYKEWQLAANVDGLYKNNLIEIKTTTNEKKLYDMYKYQINFYMWLYGIDNCTIWYVVKDDKFFQGIDHTNENNYNLDISKVQYKHFGVDTKVLDQIKKALAKFKEILQVEQLPLFIQDKNGDTYNLGIDYNNAWEYINLKKYLEI